LSPKFTFKEEEMKKSIKLLKKLEKSFPGDSLINDSGLPSEIGISDETFRLLKILEKSGLIVGFGYKLEGLPGPERERIIQAVKITPAGMDILNGLKQQRTNRLITFLTILTVIIGGIQIYLALPK
jgi:DNA-binding Lrp family transcriptional regulator